MNGIQSQQVYRCLVRQDYTYVYKGSESQTKNRRFMNRDLNAALNIRMLATEWINHRQRPAEFCRRP